MNPTLEKFGYPGSVLLELAHWVVLLRPAQATLGALVLGARTHARSFAALPPEAHAELATASRRIEAALAAFRPHDRLNYLMLMMVDPEVHFHVLPRYATVQNFNGTAFPDPGWPGLPDLKSAPVLTEAQRLDLHRALAHAFTATARA
jgi:diadenosine tetraphosphate (Ap4A) HIT family hydrolase